MRALPSEIHDALAARRLVARDFVWIVARDRTTGDPVPDGYWSDYGTIAAEVVDPDTGAAQERQFYGAAGLVAVSDIPLVSTVTVQTVTVTLSQVADRVNELIRTYDCKQAPVQIFRGLFDPATRAMVAPAECRFVGFVDDLKIGTPAEGGDGGVVMTCASHTQELTRYNPDTRSDASQKLRSATDNFYADTAVVGGWELYWGRKQGRLSQASRDGPSGGRR